MPIESSSNKKGIDKSQYLLILIVNRFYFFAESLFRWVPITAVAEFKIL